MTIDEKLAEFGIDMSSPEHDLCSKYYRYIKERDKRLGIVPPSPKKKKKGELHNVKRATS